MVDLVWQRHMLDTFNYFEDIDRFGMPGGSCHRHELYSAGTDVDDLIDPDPGATATAEMCPSPQDHSTQSHYMSTLKEYENMYGRRPREDIWPRVYDYVAQHEKRKIKIKRSASAVATLFQRRIFATVWRPMCSL
jgi:poly-beta-hydroxyalkanoate depolymerase